MPVYGEIYGFGTESNTTRKWLILRGLAPAWLSGRKDSHKSFLFLYL